MTSFPGQPMRQQMMAFGMQQHQLDHMQTICTSLQTDRLTTPTTDRSIFTRHFLMPNQQRQSTEGIRISQYKKTKPFWILTG